VLENSAYFEKKYKIERILFLKIYNLFTSMAFITVYDKCINSSEHYFNSQPSGKKKSAAVDQVVVNSSDIDLLIQSGGVDLDVVKKEAFPQLLFENKSVIDRMFEFIIKDVDHRTNILPFEPFLDLVV
jgi:hypothetical protein